MQVKRLGREYGGSEGHLVALSQRQYKPFLVARTSCEVNSNSTAVVDVKML